MRISDGSSDVCSSDLLSKNRVSVGEFANGLHPAIDERLVLVGAISGQVACVEPCLMHALGAEMMLGREPRRTVEAADRQQIGSAAGGDRGCKYVESTVGGVSLKQQKTITEQIK